MSEVCAMFSPECAGRLEWHHAIKQQRLKREFPLGALDRCWNTAQRWRPLSRLDIPCEPDKTLDDILGDTRNRVWLCSHHHELVTNGRLEVELPQSVWEFCRDFGFTGELENDLARRNAA